MVQTANVQLTANNFILNFISKNAKTFKENVSDKAIEHNDPSQEKEGDILKEWFNKLPDIKVLDHTIVPAGNLYHKDRSIIRFTLTNEYASHFVLLRGLFGFATPTGLVILSDRTDKTFVIETGVNQLENSISYFDRIFNWLSGEIKFKTALKRVILWEQKVRDEQRALFNDLHTKAA